MSDTPVGMILAAGLGTRMLPLTRVLPKPLLPFLNRPILDYTLDHFERASVARVGINLHHLGALVSEAVAGSERALRCTFVHEDPIRDSGGGIAGIWEALGGPKTTAIVANSDTIMNVDLAALLARHRASQAPVTMVVRPLTEGHPGRVFAHGDRVVGLRDLKVGPHESEHEFMGIHFIEAEVLSEIAEVSAGGTSSIVADIYMPMLRSGRRIRCELVDNFWVALDNPALMLDATRQVLDAPEIFAQSGLDALPDGIWISEGADIAPGATLVGPVLVGPSSRIAAGAQVGPYVVLDGVDVKAGAQLEDAILSDVGPVQGRWHSCIRVGQEVSTRK